LTRTLHLHSGNLYGGVETFLVTLARCRDLAPSMRVSFGLCFDGRVARELRESGAATVLLGNVRLRRPDAVWRARRNLAALLESEPFDAVICHQAWPLVIFGPVVRRARIPLVSWQHMAVSHRFWLDRLASRVVPDCIVCNSRFTASTLPPSQTRVEWIHPPVLPSAVVGPEQRRAIRQQFNTNPNDVVIVQVSRLEPMKGHDICLEALSRLHARSGWTYWVVGGAQRAHEKQYLERLRRMAASLEIAERVRFVGERADVPNVLGASDIFVQPNIEPEAFGISFVEALSAGLPVVTSSIGGACEIVDDTCGVLPAPRDRDRLRAALDRLVGQPLDRFRMSGAARIRARELCDPSVQLARIAELVGDVASRRPPRRRAGASDPVARLRIAMVSYGLPTAGQKRGGIERAAHTLAQGLAERGHTVVVFSHDAGPEGATYEVRPLPWSRFVSSWLGRRVTMGYVGNFLALLPDYADFDAVIAHGDSLLLPLKGKPVLRVMHGSALREAVHATSIGRAVLQLGVYPQELLSAFMSAGVVGVSDNTRRDNPFINRVIAHGVDLRMFQPVPHEKTVEPSLVFVGTMPGRKRGALLLDTFSRTVRAAYPKASLMFVGPPGADVEGVTYHTGVDDRELASLYRRAWLCVSPSTYEGFGLPYLEAMACGTAVVATPNAGSREVLADGQFGRLVKDEDLGATILDLLGDDNRRRALEVVGLRRAHALSLESMLDKYEGVLAELCGTRVRSVAA
jgi:glycosyltransferase involved in cell wall biosynthesis